MPGLLLAMDQPPSAIASDTTKHEIELSNGVSSQPEHASCMNGVNGSSHMKSEDIPDHDIASVNGDRPSNGGHGSILSSLDSSWRKSAANVSFGKMLERMGQGCYGDLSELVTKLSDARTDDAGVQLNGVRPTAAEDTDPASLKKKRLVMEFASTWRERFIKARIISDWARTSGEDVATCIDLRNTLRERDQRIQAAVQGILNLKVESINLKMPEPNIRGAMQYLSVGKSSYPNLGYALSKPLEAREVLDLTNEMGVQANLRIWLDEPEIPYYMSDYQIANGRVTWRTSGEFEVDLACVDQDPGKSPWYFVDLRFLFSPTPNISDEARPHLEAQINAATASQGLQGCYDFCHNYVLDYRIAEMESQAYALLRDRWFDTLRIERLRRVLTVQYWADRGGKKSWIELGVHSGKDQHPAHRPITPVNYCRWFLDGKLMEYANLGTDWTSLNLEKFLFDIQQRHAAPLLEDLEKGLKAKNPAADVLTLELRTDRAVGSNSVLLLELPSAHPACSKQITLGIAPITGKWYFAPHLEQAKSLERSIAQNPTALTTAALERLLCNVMQAGVEYEAHRRSWTLVRRMYAENQRNFKILFDNAHEVTIWKSSSPGKEWPQDWAVAYSTGLQSASWWVVQSHTWDHGHGVIAAHELLFETRAWSEGLMHIEELGLAKIQAIVLATQSTPKIPYLEEKYKRVQLTKQGPCYFVNASDLLRTEDTPRIITAPHWSIDPIRVSGGQLLRGPYKMRHEMRIAVRPGRLSHLRQYLRDNKVPGLVTNDSGGLVAQFHCTIGQPLWISARSTLRSLSTLDLCVRITTVGGLGLKLTDLDRVEIDYCSGLSVNIRCTTELSPSRSEIDLKPRRTNPHQRIRVALEAVLNKHDAAKTIAYTVFVLKSTLPLLTTVDKLAAQEESPMFNLHIRDTADYLLQYTGVPSVAFSVRGRMPVSDDQRGHRWHLEQEKASTAAVDVSEPFSKALQDFWTEPGLDCQSLKIALVTDSHGIATAIEKLHAIVKRFVVPAPTSTIDNKAIKGMDEPMKPAGPVQSVSDPDVIMLN